MRNHEKRNFSSVPFETLLIRGAIDAFRDHRLKKRLAIAKTRAYVAEILAENADARAEDALKREAEANKRATIDPLTGLPNRRAFDSTLDREIARQKRHVGAQPASILVADLDHFKKVNDTLGHNGGDKVLKDFADTFSQRMRKGDLASRWGGEEFAAILPQTDEAGAIVLAESIRERFAQTGYTVSIGVAQIDPHLAAADNIARADRALYLAKGNGRDQVIGFSQSADS